MKKLALTLGMACLFMVACNNAPKQEATQQPEAPATPEVVEEKHECPMGQLMNEYAKWDEMDETAKAELNKKACELFAQMDAEMEAKKAECEANGEAKPCCKEGEEHKCQHEGEEGHKCQHEGEHQCQHQMAEMTEEQKAECEAKCAEMKAKCEEMKAAWDNFENLTLDEQKDLVLDRIAFVKGMQCHHEGEGEEHHCCGKHEGEEGHECQHAAE